MESSYNERMISLGYSQLVCDIFSEWEGVKDELLAKDKKQGTGSGTIHVFLGNADAALRKEFPSYYEAVEKGEEPSVGAIGITHYFSANNIISMLGFVCKFYSDKGEDFASKIQPMLEALSSYADTDIVSTTSLLKLSLGSERLRPYFKQFDPKGVFAKVIRNLLIKESAYKISLYKNADGEYATYWLIGAAGMSDFDANPNKRLMAPQIRPIENKAFGPLQQICYGAPGTGKSHKTDEVAALYEDTVRTTFHPDSDYTTFVGVYKPTMRVENRYDLYAKETVGLKYPDGDREGQAITENRIEYRFVKQAFLKAYVRAWHKMARHSGGGAPEPQFLVVEEINRGNCAQIFGDLFQLLDRKGGFSEYPIEADEDIRQALLEEGGDSFGPGGLELPEGWKARINATIGRGADVAGRIARGEVLALPCNLYIWATMNTSDQSLFPIDSAFKRRWEWKYMRIKDAGKGWTVRLKYADKEGAEHPSLAWWDFLEAINEQIYQTTKSEDKQLGYFFCKPTEKACEADGEPTVITPETFVGKVLFFLWQDVFRAAGYRSPIFRYKKHDRDFTLKFHDFYGGEATEANPEGIDMDLLSTFVTNVMKTV